MKSIDENLKKKGWDNEEIKRALTILKYGKSNQKNFHNFSQKTIYWIALFVLIIINIILSIMLVPFMITVKHSLVYIFIIIFSSGFGYIFNFLLKDIEFSDPAHHIVAGLFIPAIAIINIYIVVNLTNYFLKLMQFPYSYSPIISSFIYVTAFMMPYLYSKIPDIIDNVVRFEKNL